MENMSEAQIKQYKLNFMLQLRLHPLSLQKPKDLPDMDVVKEKLYLPHINDFASEDKSTDINSSYASLKNDYCSETIADTNNENIEMDSWPILKLLAWRLFTWVLRFLQNLFQYLVDSLNRGLERDMAVYKMLHQSRKTTLYKDRSTVTELDVAVSQDEDPGPVVGIMENMSEAQIKQYKRDFMLQLRLHPLSLQKPKDLPDMDVVKEKLYLPDINDFVSEDKSTDINSSYASLKNDYSETIADTNSENSEMDSWPLLKLLAWRLFTWVSSILRNLLQHILDSMVYKTKVAPELVNLPHEESTVVDTSVNQEEAPGP